MTVTHQYSRCGSTWLLLTNRRAGGSVEVNSTQVNWWGLKEVKCVCVCEKRSGFSCRRSLRSVFFPAVDIYHSLTSAEGWNYMKSAGGECLILQTSVMEDQVKVLQSKFKFTKVKYSCSNKLQVPKVKETQKYLLTKKRRSLFCHQRSAESCSSERCVNEYKT